MEKQILNVAQHGDVRMLKKLHELNDSLHWSQCRSAKVGDTPLHLAAQTNNLQVIKYLCEHWSPNCIDICNKDGKTALHDAAQFHNYDVITYLISKGASVDALKRADWTPLMLACAKQSENKYDSYSSVHALITNRAERLICNKDGWTSQHLCARVGDLSIFKLIWLNDVKELVNKTRNGRTVLHIAALHGHTPLMRYFISKGVSGDNLNVTDNCGNTVFHDAVLSGDLELVQLLQVNGADIYKFTKVGLSSLHLAAQSGMIAIISYLVSHCNFDVNIISDQSGKFTPLHCAYRSKQNDAIEILIQLGADEYILDGKGRTAKDYA